MAISAAQIIALAEKLESTEPHRIRVHPETARLLWEKAGHEAVYGGIPFQRHLALCVSSGLLRPMRTRAKSVQTTQSATQTP